MSDADAPLVPELFALSEAAHGLSQRLAARADPTVPAGAAAAMLDHAVKVWPVLKAYPKYADLAATFARLGDLAPAAQGLVAATGTIHATLAALHPLLRDRVQALILPLGTAVQEEYAFPLLQPLGLARVFGAGKGVYSGFFDELAAAWREADAKSGGKHTAEVEAVIAAYAAPREAVLAAMTDFDAPAAETRAAIGRCLQATQAVAALVAEAETLGEGLRAANVAMRPGGSSVKRAAGMVGPAAFTLGFDTSDITDETKKSLLLMLEGALGMIAASIDLGPHSAALARAAAPLAGLADQAQGLAGRLDAGRDALGESLSALESLAEGFAGRIAAWEAAQEALADPAFIARQEALAAALGLDAG